MKKVIRRIINKLTSLGASNKEKLCMRLEANLSYELRKRMLEANILSMKESGITDEQYMDHSIIVSLTTYGKRLYEVAPVVESLMEQTMKANRIILWLGDDLKSVKLPVSLTLLQGRGLEIRYCDDIKSYKKLVPSLMQFPEAAIITVDDDLLYENELLEHLIVAYQANSSYIYTHRAHKMKLTSDGLVARYLDWEHCRFFSTPDILCFPTGGGGTLYPPHSLDDEVLNANVFMDICPTADDVWFKAMALKKGTYSMSVFSHNKDGDDFLQNENVQDDCLLLHNIGRGQNDIQLTKVFGKYDLFSKFT